MLVYWYICIRKYHKFYFFKLFYCNKHVICQNLFTEMHLTVFFYKKNFFAFVTNIALYVNHYFFHFFKTFAGLLQIIFWAFFYTNLHYIINITILLHWFYVLLVKFDRLNIRLNVFKLKEIILITFFTIFFSFVLFY